MSVNLNADNLNISNLSLGGGSQGFGSLRKGGENGMSEMVHQALEHFLKDGKLDREEAKLLEKMAKAEKKDECGDKKKCGDKDKDENKCDKAGKCDDDVAKDYMKSALKDGKLSPLERRVAMQLFNNSNRSGFA